MLARRDAHGNRRADLQAKNMLGVLGHSRRIAPAPLRKNFVAMLKLPIPQPVFRGVESGFLSELAHCGLFQCLAFALTARHRLPETGMIGTLEQQNFELRRVDDHQDRDRNLQPALRDRHCRSGQWQAGTKSRICRRPALTISPPRRADGYATRATAARPPDSVHAPADPVRAASLEMRSRREWIRLRPSTSRYDPAQMPDRRAAAPHTAARPTRIRTCCALLPARC